MDLITIAIPVYNVEKYVEASLFSALNQTYENIEYIIADDNGTDNSMNIVQDIIAKHPRGKSVRIIAHEKNIGLGAGRNTGIDNAHGKYIFFMDSDDEITPDCIEVLYGRMMETPADFVASSLVCKDRNKNVLKKYIYENQLLKGESEIAYHFYSNKKRWIMVWNRLYDLSFLKKNNIRCIPHHSNEDNLFTFQVVLNALSCRYISDVTYTYYDTPDSIVKNAQYNRISERYAKQYIESIDFKKEYMKRYSDSRLRETIFRYIIFQTKYYAGKISDSKILDKNQKKYYLKNLLVFPVSFREILKFKNPTFFVFMYFVFKLPLTLTGFRIMDSFASRKTIS